LNKSCVEFNSAKIHGNSAGNDLKVKFYEVIVVTMPKYGSETRFLMDLKRGKLK
jgi:hypothetical protein